MIDSLAAEIRDGRAILFVGAGVSAGLGLPSWSELIDRLGEDLGFDADVFAALSSSFLPLAEYYRLEKGSIGALRSWMDREWAVDDQKLRHFRPHELIIELGFQLIYTTNYDRLLERSFELRQHKINKIVNARDIARADVKLPTIVKFHGDFDDDTSLVLSESDYFHRLAFDAPLDVKLRADALGRSILFIGYSLSDINIRLMLFRMKNMWRDSGYESSQPRSYIFMPRPNVVQERVLKAWGIDPIVSDVAQEGDALNTFLAELLNAVREGRP